ncbi:MAG TPA: rhodanese-like domain-containing protein [Bacteroidales bacterium]|nr:rhodanese-like domain-containing protein [Bacteroidales bacterium]
MRFIIKTAVLTVLPVILLAACSGGSKPVAAGKAEPAPRTAPSIGNETQLLLKELRDGGDYVTSKQYPSLIKASLVYEALSGKNLIVDLRSKADFASGHIKGAVNKKFEDLPAWFETGIKPFEYEKIILVCNDGQASCYATSLLRLKGYGNVYAMRWGMSGWSKQVADKNWLAALSGKYETGLDTVTRNKPEPMAMPGLNTGKSTGKDVADAMFAKLFAEGTSGLFITAGEVFANPSNYYIINLERKDKYNDGHIPGAVRYKPDGTLGVTDELLTIPAGRTVVVYCGTGHSSAFATAYLRLLGYDARTLRYGNNSFMHDRMVSKREALSWLPFSEADVNNFPLVK